MRFVLVTNETTHLRDLPGTKSSLRHVPLSPYEEHTTTPYNRVTYVRVRHDGSLSSLGLRRYTEFADPSSMDQEDVISQAVVRFDVPKKFGELLLAALKDNMGDDLSGQDENCFAFVARLLTGRRYGVAETRTLGATKVHNGSVVTDFSQLRLGSELIIAASRPYRPGEQRSLTVNAKCPEHSGVVIPAKRRVETSDGQVGEWVETMILVGRMATGHGRFDASPVEDVVGRYRYDILERTDFRHTAYDRAGMSVDAYSVPVTVDGLEPVQGYEVWP